MVIKGLVFSGGGLRGYAYVGVLKALEEANLMSQIELYAGCSIGAVFATLISVGYNSVDLYDFVVNFNYQDIRDVNILGLIESYGVETGVKIQEFLRLMLRKRTELENPTFGDLYRLTGKRLVINATCINTHEMEYFDYCSWPNMPVALALRMSISIPFLFTPVYYSGRLWVDGAVIDNFPIQSEYNPKEILGIQLTGKTSESAKINNFAEFALHTWSSLYGELTRLKLASISDFRYLTIPIHTIHTLNFMPDRAQRMEVYNQGYVVAQRYLNEYVNTPITEDPGKIDKDEISSLDNLAK